MNEEVRIGEFQQEYTLPVEDYVAKLGQVFYFLGAVTRPSTIKTPDSNPAAPIQRLLMTRTIRAELLKQFENTPKADKKARQRITTEAHDWDRLARQFLNQAEIHVTLPGLGEQTARYNVLTPQSEDTQGAETRPQLAPIFIVPGLSNDLDCIAYIAQRLAKSDRTVISVGYPESFMGKTTREFENAVIQQNNFRLHAEFFRKAMEAILGTTSSVELWGLSAGSPIVAQILNEKIIQERVKQAVLISPAACVNQSNLSMNLGVASELPKLIKRYSDIFPKLVLTAGRKEESRNEFRSCHCEEGVLDRRGNLPRNRAIVPILYKAIQSNHPTLWKNMRVREGGNIVVITGSEDEITKAYQAKGAFTKNSQVKYAVIPGEFHASSFNSPAVFNKVVELSA